MPHARAQTHTHAHTHLQVRDRLLVAQSIERQAAGAEVALQPICQRLVGRDAVDSCVRRAGGVAQQLVQIGDRLTRLGDVTAPQLSYL